MVSRITLLGGRQVEFDLKQKIFSTLAEAGALIFAANSWRLD